MKNRSVIAVLLLTIVTLGIYGLYWYVSTKLEMNKRGATIPTAWLIIIPLVNIWWLWKYCEGVDKETNGKLSTVISFLLLFLLGVIGMMIIQHEFNKGDTAPVTAVEAPVAPVEPVVPVSPAEPVAVTPTEVTSAPPVPSTEPTAVTAPEPAQEQQNTPPTTPTAV